VNVAPTGFPEHTEEGPLTLICDWQVLKEMSSMPTSLPLATLVAFTICKSTLSVVAVKDPDIFTQIGVVLDLSGPELAMTFPFTLKERFGSVPDAPLGNKLMAHAENS
jgi:hypothetical protein